MLGFGNLETPRIQVEALLHQASGLIQRENFWYMGIPGSSGVSINSYNDNNFHKILVVATTSLIKVFADKTKIIRNCCKLFAEF